MKNCQPILLFIALIMALNLMLPAAPPKPGYLNRGTPFGLRKWIAPGLRFTRCRR